MSGLVALDALSTCSLTITVTLPFALVAGYLAGRRRERSAVSRSKPRGEEWHRQQGP